MYIFRVAISFMRDHMHHMHERAVLAMGPGQALGDCLAGLNIYPHAVNSFKAYVIQPDSLGEFSRDELILPVIGSDQRLEDLWKRKHGDQ
jgi:hypothetical protein